LFKKTLSKVKIKYTLKQFKVIIFIFHNLKKVLAGIRDGGRG